MYWRQRSIWRWTFLGAERLLRPCRHVVDHRVQIAPEYCSMCTSTGSKSACSTSRSTAAVIHVEAHGFSVVDHQTGVRRSGRRPVRAGAMIITSRSPLGPRHVFDRVRSLEESVEAHLLGSRCRSAPGSRAAERPRPCDVLRRSWGRSGPVQVRDVTGSRRPRGVQIQRGCCQGTGTTRRIRRVHHGRPGCFRPGVDPETGVPDAVTCTNDFSGG